jgi:hypothetical protein
LRDGFRAGAINLAAQIPHYPLPVDVMGDRTIRREPATA